MDGSGLTPSQQANIWRSEQGTAAIESYVSSRIAETCKLASPLRVRVSDLGEEFSADIREVLSTRCGQPHTVNRAVIDVLDRHVEGISAGILRQRQREMYATEGIPSHMDLPGNDSESIRGNHEMSVERFINGKTRSVYDQVNALYGDV